MSRTRHRLFVALALATTLAAGIGFSAADASPSVVAGGCCTK